MEKLGRVCTNFSSRCWYMRIRWRRFMFRRVCHIAWTLFGTVWYFGSYALQHFALCTILRHTPTALSDCSSEARQVSCRTLLPSLGTHPLHTPCPLLTACPCKFPVVLASSTSVLQDRRLPNPAINDVRLASFRPLRQRESLLSNRHDFFRRIAILFFTRTGAVRMNFDIGTV